MAKIAYGKHYSRGAVGVMCLCHFVSLGVRLQSRKSSIFWTCNRRGQNKPQIWNPRPQFAYSLYNFYKATITIIIKGTLLLTTPLLSVQSKKSPVLAKISTFFAII